MMNASKINRRADFGLFEFGFDQDMAPEQLERLLKVFPSEETVHENIMDFRRNMGYVDMKRGELYPEVIGSVQRLRRTIAKAYEIDLVQAQPNFACNGCIDALMTYIRIAWSEQICVRRGQFLNKLKNDYSLNKIISLKTLDLIETEISSPDKPTLVVAAPTYFRYYSATDSKRIKLKTVLMRQDYSYPLNEIMEAIRKEKAFALILVSPNNPTGIPIPDDMLHTILKEVPDDFIVALDRTCANVDPEISTEQLIKLYPSKCLVVFHSFSKYYSMSHIRIGFSVFSNPEFAKEVEPMLPFGLNLEGALKATKILSQGPLKPGAQVLERIKINQQLLRDFQEAAKGYYITPFTSNYALMQLPEEIDSDTFSKALLSEGIFVMPGHQTPEPNPHVVRIHTGGIPETTERMIKIINTKFKRG